MRQICFLKPRFYLIAGPEYTNISFTRFKVFLFPAATLARSYSFFSPHFCVISFPKLQMSPSPSLSRGGINCHPPPPWTADAPLLNLPHEQWGYIYQACGIKDPFDAPPVAETAQSATRFSKAPEENFLSRDRVPDQIHEFAVLDNNVDVVGGGGALSQLLPGVFLVKSHWEPICLVVRSQRS